MGGEQQFGAGASAAVTRLQLGDGVTNSSSALVKSADALLPVISARFAELGLAGITTELDDVGLDPDTFDLAVLSGEERAGLETAAASLQRRLDDARLLEQLAADGFTGAKYEMFESQLVAYALPVLQSWLRRGLIFGYCSKRGRPVTCGLADRMFLAENENFDERLSLAGLVIASAIPIFRRTALAEGGWRPEGGASLPTYFVGACLNAFPNVFRAWKRARTKWRKAEGLGADAPDSRVPGRPAATNDPADLVVSKQFVLDVLADMPKTARAAAARVVVYDETQAEVAEALGMTSERSVEGHFYRYRKEHQRRQDLRRDS